MEKYQKSFSVEELQKILNDYMGVKNTRIHCLMGEYGLNWDGVLVSVYDDGEEERKES